jgi:hypothetical protein
MQIEINWLELIRANEGEILEAGRRAFKNACGSSGPKEYTEDAKINMYGAVEQYENHQDYCPLDVWLGQAVAIFSFSRFDPWDYEQEVEKTIFALLDAIQAEEFRKYLKQQNLERIDRIDLENWSETVCETINSKYLEYYINKHIEEQVQQQYNKFLEDLMKPCPL